MKRSTGIGHAVEMATEATELLRLRDTDVGWLLEELWVTGDLLGKDRELEFAEVVLVLDVAAEELPWLATHRAGEWVGDRLRLGKRPVLWCYRPVGWPAWNARHRRVARVWSAATGLDATAIEALRSSEDPGVVEPSDHEFRVQLDEERQVSQAHLRRVVEEYWEPGWRRQHRGGEAEDQLWRAAAAIVEIDDALAELEA